MSAEGSLNPRYPGFKVSQMQSICSVRVMGKRSAGPFSISIPPHLPLQEDSLNRRYSGSRSPRCGATRRSVHESRGLLDLSLSFTPSSAAGEYPAPSFHLISFSASKKVQPNRLNLFVFCCFSDISQQSGKSDCGADQCCGKLLFFLFCQSIAAEADCSDGKT